MKVNLKEFFGDKIPRDQAFREAVGQAIIDTILERTSRGVSVEGKNFTRYSDSYTESLDFDAAGKSVGDVNLRLSGDMLDQLDVKKIEGNTITIGWDQSSESEKAHGHITGGGHLPKRNFFGLRPGEARSIKSEFKSALKTFEEGKKKEFRDKIVTILNTFKETEDAD